MACSYIQNGPEGRKHRSFSPPPSSAGRYNGRRERTGATFFLNLTNPSAANMLESFTDDDPIETSRYCIAADKHNLEIGDDGFLLYFNGFMFDLQVGTDHEHVPAVSESTLSDPMASMFGSETSMTLHTKTDMTITDLHALHQSLLTNDKSYGGCFDEDTVKDVLAPKCIMIFAATYFRLTHHHVPLVHRRSFGSEETAPALLLAVTLVGAVRSAPHDDALCVRSLSRLLEEYIFLRLAYLMSHGASDSKLEMTEIEETLQAAILVHNVQFMANDVATRRRLRTQRLPALVSAVRQLGLFTTRHSLDADHVRHIKEESCIR